MLGLTAMLVTGETVPPSSVGSGYAPLAMPADLREIGRPVRWDRRVALVVALVTGVVSWERARRRRS
ncbi:MAG: hypothetical protein M0Z87_06550 [Actinomycetota bacterium]|nr:hypothetical protein [Actinomycetota bacterium]